MPEPDPRTIVLAEGIGKILRGHVGTIAEWAEVSPELSRIFLTIQDVNGTMHRFTLEIRKDQ